MLSSVQLGPPAPAPQQIFDCRNQLIQVRYNPNTVS